MNLRHTEHLPSSFVLLHVSLMLAAKSFYMLLIDAADMAGCQTANAMAECRPKQWE